MKTVQLVRFGPADRAFSIVNQPDPSPQPNEVLIAVEGFGLNFADVLARQGLYNDCPPLPTVLGYEAVGRIEALGEKVQGFNIGQRVLAFTRFNGYASKLIAQPHAILPIGDDLPLATATALATQYSTAWYPSQMATTLQPNDHVLVQSAAGGVGTALVQLAKHKGCVIYGTASGGKLPYLEKIGVNYPIDYQKNNFATEIKRLAPNGKIDIIFDALGGASVRKGMGLLQAGGRMVSYGVANFSGKNKLNMVKHVAQFGFFHPVQFLSASISFIGVNMLRIADQRPDLLQTCLQQTMAAYQQGIVNPQSGGVYPIQELAQAHTALEKRQTTGKLAISW